jgi:hypothetical protein
LFAFVLLVFSKGKDYYYFPLILGILPFGSVLAEGFLKEEKWILTAYLSIICCFGIVLLPKALPVLPMDTYIRLYHLQRNKDNRIPMPFENYYSREIWDQILKTVSSTYNKLPVTEKEHCLIWGRHYSQSGGINLFGGRYGLPSAFSFHSSCYNWVPAFSDKITVIVIADPSWDQEHWLRFFREVNEVAVVENLYASDRKWYFQRIYLCKGLKYSSNELKELFRNEIF